MKSLAVIAGLALAGFFYHTALCRAGNQDSVCAFFVPH